MDGQTSENGGKQIGQRDGSRSRDTSQVREMEPSCRRSVPRLKRRKRRYLPFNKKRPWRLPKGLLRSSVIRVRNGLKCFISKTTYTKSQSNKGQNMIRHEFGTKTSICRLTSLPTLRIVFNSYFIHVVFLRCTFFFYKETNLSESHDTSPVPVIVRTFLDLKRTLYY